MVSAKEQALEELTEYELWLDPDGCHMVERLIYILTLSICLGVYFAEPVLRCCRLYALRTAQSRTLFRLTTTLPCAIYGPASAALLIMCWGDDTQEGALYVLLLTVQTLMMAHFGRLLRDAMRDGLDARVFELPLERHEWIWLLSTFTFHFALFITSIALLVDFQIRGPPIFLLEAEALLRPHKNPGVACRPAERHAYGALLGACGAIGLLATALIRRAASAYYTAWVRGAAVPAGAMAIAYAMCAAACFDQNWPQEEPLYISTLTISLAALIANIILARRAEVATRWLHIALGPFNLGAAVAASACLIHLEVSGPLLHTGFVEIWSTEPTPESAAYIFGCLPLFYLLAVLSVVLHDPDESEPQRAPPKPRRAEEHEMAELGSTRTLRGGPRIVDAGEPADGQCAPGGGGGRRTIPLRQRLRAIRAAARGAPKGKGTRAGQPLGDAAYFGAGQTSRRGGDGGTRRVMIDSELDRELMT